ncbi:MAG TPA: cyanophycinase [Ohtaekwangia sp.]|nr:cyanophycinase [Ohtaekwangia sp.]
MTRFITFAILFFLSTNAAEAQSKTPKGKLFIIGGGSRPDAMVERIIAEAKLREGGYAVILPMSSSEPDSAVYYASAQFIKKGISQVFGLHFVKGESYTAAKLDSIRNARLIYISGGDQNRFMEVVRGTEIEKAIHDAYQRGSIVGGTSAGAAVMSKVMITGNELKHPDYESTFRNIEAANIETKPGLGLIQNAIIDQHFVRRSRHNRLISAIIEYPELTGIGIDEATAILVSGNEAEVVGNAQVIVLENTKRSRVVRNGKLGATGIQMSVLLPGDKFKIR